MTIPSMIFLFITCVIVLFVIVAGCVFIANAKKPVATIAIGTNNGYQEYSAYRTQTGFTYIYLFGDMVFVPTDELSGILQTDSGSKYYYEWMTNPNIEHSAKPKLDEV